MSRYLKTARHAFVELPCCGLLLLSLAFGGCHKSADEYLHRAHEAAYRKDPQRALREFRLALDAVDRIETAGAQAVRARALRGAADIYYLELRDIPRAVEAYRELLQVCPEAPESIEGHIYLGDILKNHYRDLRGAIGELNAAVAHHAPQSAELSYRIAKMYFQLANYPQCVLEADRVVDRFGNSAFADDALLLKAQALSMMENKRADATRVLETLIDRFPDSELQPHALFELGKLHDEMGEPEKAIECWVEALRRHPDPAVVQAAILRVRKRIESQTPLRIGDHLSAFDRQRTRPAAHRTNPPQDVIESRPESERGIAE
jgi:tetratricopeptide (TPR) repeat protein